MADCKAQAPHGHFLSLAEGDGSNRVRGDWIGKILMLGKQLARHSDLSSSRQLIVVITVPSRDYAAALIGAGWILGRPPLETASDPIPVLREARIGTHYRAVFGTSVVSGQFRGLDETRTPARVSLAGTWAAKSMEAVAPISEASLTGKMGRPAIRSIGRMSGIDRDWAQRLVAPQADLVIVGTMSRISKDLEATLAYGEDEDGDPLKTLLLPRDQRSVTWFSHIYSSSGFSDQLPLSSNIALVILDGQPAIRYLNRILSPMVVCIIDRSVADESAADQLIQLRNSRGSQLSLSLKLGWRPPNGVEVLGFTVPL